MSYALQDIHNFKMTMSRYQEGDKVKWKWGDGDAEGTVQSTFAEKTTRTIKGSEVTRNGSQDDKAVYIEQKDGDNVLKLESELEKA